MVETTPYQPIFLTFVQKDRSRSDNTPTQNILDRLHKPGIFTAAPSAAVEGRPIGGRAYPP